MCFLASRRVSYCTHIISFLDGRLGRLGVLRAQGLEFSRFCTDIIQFHLITSHHSCQGVSRADVLARVDAPRRCHRELSCSRPVVKDSQRASCPPHHHIAPSALTAFIMVSFRGSALSGLPRLASVDATMQAGWAAPSAIGVW